ncbi:hypothetical protein [Serratia sp. M24T3]|uniref:hypothetical protein n=1 Tax=Serratia sp. M24T3 TaxID=932213 RepID=UPI00025BBCE1|nr:hypothetical protein [Serratia sp. M24T3]EIC82057.1 hypothetical protein SPM24T3_23787 [Serratia sp. M24T3]
MKSYIFAALLILPLTAKAEAEDFTESFSKCVVMDNDQQRLACYDKIRDDIVKSESETKKSTSEYPAIDINDLKVDFEKLNGHKFSVAAYVQSFAGTYFLKSGTMDMNPISANMDNLPREDRKKLISGCQTTLCLGVFYGVVNKDDYETKFIVKKVQWDDK